MKEYFKIVITHTVSLDNGKVKKIKEVYLYDTMSFTESESKASELIEQAELKDAFIDSIKRVKYTKIEEFSDNETYFEIDLKEEYENEKGKTTFVKQKYLVLISCVGAAEDYINKLYSETDIPIKIQSVKNAKIVEFIEV